MFLACVEDLGKHERLVSIWNITNGLKVAKINSGHEGELTGLLTTQENKLVSCSRDFKVKIYG
jgi:hypothetical protein